MKAVFGLDVTLLLSLCALQTVSFTGLVIHEWLGLAMVGMVLAHLLLAWSWIASQSSGTVVILAAFHLAINWDWVLAAVLKFFNRAQEGAL